MKYLIILLLLSSCAQVPSRHAQSSQESVPQAAQVPYKNTMAQDIETLKIQVDLLMSALYKLKEYKQCWNEVHTEYSGIVANWSDEQIEGYYTASEECVGD